jgi:hypothetical protein
MLLEDTSIERAYGPPEGYDDELQGKWDDSLLAFSFKHKVKIEKVERESNYLYIEFKISDLGSWSMEIETEKVTIERI